MTEKKITKRDNFVTIFDVLMNAGREDLAEVIEHEIELLDAKSAKAKANAAKKKAESDALTEAIYSVLTDELTTINDITNKVVSDEEVTVGRAQARLNKLVDAGRAYKEQITVTAEGSKSRKLMAYRRPDSVAEVTEN